MMTMIPYCRRPRAPGAGHCVCPTIVLMTPGGRQLGRPSPVVPWMPSHATPCHVMQVQVQCTSRLGRQDHRAGAGAGAGALAPHPPCPRQSPPLPLTTTARLGPGTISAMSPSRCSPPATCRPIDVRGLPRLPAVVLSCLAYRAPSEPRSGTAVRSSQYGRQTAGFSTCPSPSCSTVIATTSRVMTTINSHVYYKSANFAQN